MIPLVRRGVLIASALAGFALLDASRPAHAGEDGLYSASPQPYPFLCQCFQSPYSSSSCLYGYLDHVYGRGPVIDLGSAALSPGLRGYGPFGSPGYGLGTIPTSRIDRRKPRIGIFGQIHREPRQSRGFAAGK